MSETSCSSPFSLQTEGWRWSEELRIAEPTAEENGLKLNIQMSLKTDLLTCTNPDIII